MRVIKSDYILDWENNRQQEIKELTSQGVVPFSREQEKLEEKGVMPSPKEVMGMRPWLSGAAAGAIDDIKPAAGTNHHTYAFPALTCTEIIESMINTAIAIIRKNHSQIARL